MRIHELPSQPLIIKACASTYVVFGVMLGVPLLVSLAVALLNGSSWSALAAVLFALALTFVWIASFKLVIANEVISYRTLFTGTRSVALAEIERCYLETGYERGQDPMKPPIRLVIRPRQSTGKKPISVNLKVLSRSDALWLRKILERGDSRW